MKFRIDTFTLLLLGAIVLATFLPATGQMGGILATAGTVAVALLFFFHGAALSREQIIAGATHWRLHILIASLTFIFFPAGGIAHQRAQRHCADLDAERPGPWLPVPGCTAIRGFLFHRLHGHGPG